MNLLVKRYLWGLAIIAALIVTTSPTMQATMDKTYASNDGWVVPKIAPHAGDADGALRDLAQSTLWGAPKESANLVDEKASRWRIAGITGRPSERYVIVQFGDDRIQQLKVGDKFPDGTLISEVRDRGICVLLSGKRRLLPIDGQMSPIIW